MFTLDASVHINALNPTEDGHTTSWLCLQRLAAKRQSIFSPTLLLVEVAAAIARALDGGQLALDMLQGIRNLPHQLWISLNDAIANVAAQLGAQARLRGADAVYAAVAQRYGATLVTRDRQQLEQLPSLIPAGTPTEVLSAMVTL